MSQLDQGNKLLIDITYQDTDIAGVVYFANYFNYAEKGRSKLLKHYFGKTKFSQNQNWAVKETKASYLSPATIDQTVVLKTGIKELKKASVIFYHDFYIEDTLICSMEAVLLSINEDLKPSRINQEIYSKLILIYDLTNKR